jgi:hypothetical protein
MAAIDVIASELLKSAKEADLNYKKTRDLAERDKAIRLRKIVENLRLLTFGASELDELTDVTISAPVNGQVLTYNSSTGQWENQAGGGGGGGGVTQIVAGTNISISPVGGTGVVTINSPVSAGSTGFYGAFSDYTNQTAAAINTGYPMRLGVTDLNNEVTIQSNSRITFNFAGKYNLQWSGQFVNPDTQEHDVSVWLRRNGTNVTGSNGFVSVVSRHGGIDGHVLPAWNYVVDVSANDYYEFVWSTSSTQVYLASRPVTAFSPSTASVIVTATPVSAGSDSESVGSKLYLFNNL